MIKQSAINTKPPIKVIIKQTTRKFWGGNNTVSGEIKIGNIYDLTFWGQSEHFVEIIEEAVKKAYDLGYSEASTHFLNQKSSMKYEGSFICPDNPLPPPKPPSLEYDKIGGHS